MTSYAYTSAGKLASVTDPSHTTWAFKYDQLGYRIESDDPDRGTSHTTYDPAGHILTVTDARGQTLAYSYDGQARKTALFSGSTSGTRLADWTYDTVTAGKGQLATSARYGDGGARYITSIDAYDALYRPNRTTFSIPSREGALAGDYQFSTLYNTDGTPQGNGIAATPDLPGEAAIIGYDDLHQPITLQGGQVTAPVSYITNASYSHTGKPTLLEESTGGAKTQTAYSYERGTNRLAEAITARTGIPGIDRDAVYSYDDAGDLTSVDDRSRAGEDHQCFTYDYLQRLTNAWTTIPAATGACTAAPTSGNAATTTGGPAPYWQAYTYDGTSANRKTVTTYTPTADGNGAISTQNYTFPAPGGPPGSQPHALTGVQTTGAAPGSDALTYDPTGNLLTRTTKANGALDKQQALQWDAEGHLTQITVGTDTTSYLYDAAGNRLIRRDASGTTLTLPGEELHLATDGKTVKTTRYYSFGGQTIASRTNDGGTTFMVADPHGTSELAVQAASTTENGLTQRRTLPFG